MQQQCRPTDQTAAQCHYYYFQSCAQINAEIYSWSATAAQRQLLWDGWRMWLVAPWPHDLRRATGKACMIPIILGRLDSSYRDGERDNSRRCGRTKMPLWCNTHTHSCQSLVGTRPSQPRQRPPESERCNVFVTTQRATEWKRRLMAVSSVEHELEVDDAPETRAMKDVSTHIPIIEKSARRKCLSGSLPCVFCASKRLSVLLIIRRQAFCGLFYEIQIRKFTTCTERSSGHCTYIGAYTVSQKTRH